MLIRSTKLMMLVAPVVAAGALLAGCGSGGDTTSSATPPAADTGSQTTAAPSAHKAKLLAPMKVTLSVRSSDFGKVIFNQDGQVVYAFENDTTNTSNCSGECADFWPPVLVDGTPTAGAGLDGAKIATITRPDGGIQATYNGWPLLHGRASGRGPLPEHGHARRALVGGRRRREPRQGVVMDPGAQRVRSFGGRRLVWVAGLAVAAAVIAIGVSVRGESTIRPGSDGATGSVARAQVAGATERLPSVTLRDDRDRPVDIAAIRGPAAIHVFASWCPSCQAEAATITMVQRDHPELTFHYLNVADDPADARSFISRYGWRDGPVLVDHDRAAASALGLSGQPHTVFVTRDGTVARHVGPGTFEQLDALARAVTAPAPAA